MSSLFLSCSVSLPVKFYHLLVFGIVEFDVFGNAHGLLAAHPVTPFISMHHLELIEPVFPGLTALEGLKQLMTAMRTDPGNFLQQSICYDHELGLSFSISLGPVPMSICKQPFLFYMEEMHVVESNRQTVSMYKRYSKVDEAKKHAYCWFHHMAPQRLKQITVVTDFVAMQWYMVSLSWCVPQLCISVWGLPVSHVSLVSGQVHDNRIAAIVLP
ncbi:unnamed protein product [Sphagnum jensenii]|uniref:Uncharacterized protein n=1 Tax=Sphagnum jensenii TaxID=128206 RepID=A0ABP1B9X7_9BRYO